MSKGRIPNGFADRGAELEHIVTSSLEVATEAGLAYWKVSPPFTGRPLPGGQWVGRFVGYGCLDYVGDLNGHAMYLDAKQTAEPRLSLAETHLRPHQVDIVRDRTAKNAMACFLVGFMDLDPQEFYLLDWTVLGPYIEAYRRRIPGDKTPASIPVAVFRERAIPVPMRGLFLDVIAALATLDLRLPYGGTR